MPHHHHEEANATHQSNDQDDDHDDIDNSFLGQAFSHFQHNGNSPITFKAPSSTFQSSQYSIDKEAFLFTQYVIRQLLKPPILYSEHHSFVFTPFNYSASSLFRGPPMA